MMVKVSTNSSNPSASLTGWQTATVPMSSNASTYLAGQQLRSSRMSQLAMIETSDGPLDRTYNVEEARAAGDPERSLWNRQLSSRIGYALEQLTPRERMVFELRHYQGMRLRAIGEILDTTEEAAKNCLFRATQKMRAGLGDFV